MRLKTTLSKQIQLLQNKNLNTLLLGDDNRSNDLMLNGSTSSSSASAGVDDLEMDSADDDEIDVGTNADYNQSSHQSLNDSLSQQLSSAALNGINNDHQFGGLNSTQSNGVPKSFASNSMSGLSEADRKRAHHNALERKRRDHIKDSFHTLRDAIPNIRGEKTSRAQILKAATDYIKIMRNRNCDFQNDIDSLKKANMDIENQIRQLEKARQATLAASAGSHHIKQQSTETKLEPTNYMDQIEDFKFDLNDTSSSSSSNQVLPLTNSTFQLNLNQPIQQTLSNSNTNQVLILNKPTLGANGTTTITTLANSKKLKTIINTKNNLNIINLNTATTTTTTTSAAINPTSSNLSTHTLNAILRPNDSLDNYL